LIEAPFLFALHRGSSAQNVLEILRFARLRCGSR